MPCLQVTSFIREELRENMQIIVISLKEEFFSRADSLLGVYSDVTEPFFYFFKLEKYKFVLDQSGESLSSLFCSLMNACSAAF